MILTNPNKNAILLGSDRGTDFLLTDNKAQSRSERLNRFSIADRNVPFLLEGIMLNRTEYKKEWWKQNKDKAKIYQKRFYDERPWQRTMKAILARCKYNKNAPYYKKGIRNFLTMDNLKYLWHRDKAYLMDKPSIDRIDSKGHYTLENCRYKELSENTGDGHRGKPMSRISTLRRFRTMRLKMIKLNDACIDCKSLGANYPECKDCTTKKLRDILKRMLGKNV